MSYFASSDEAERYAASRPYFHPLAIKRAAKALGIGTKARLAIDAACGTGLSAAALTPVAEMVVAFDISWHMLSNAKQAARLTYVQAQAEAMPLPSGIAPIMSCALAFHWLDRASFLSEACRVLEPGGVLMIYNNGFTGVMRGSPAFQDFSQKLYVQRFPSPPRDWRPLTAEEARKSDFDLIDEERYENEIVFSPGDLVAYLTTQTNVAAAVERGRESLESASRWLDRQVRPYFVEEKGTFVFATRAWYLRKVTPA